MHELVTFLCFFQARSVATVVVVVAVVILEELFDWSVQRLVDWLILLLVAVEGRKIIRFLFVLVRPLLCFEASGV